MLWVPHCTHAGAFRSPPVCSAHPLTVLATTQPYHAGWAHCVAYRATPKIILAGVLYQRLHACVSVEQARLEAASAGSRATPDMADLQAKEACIEAKMPA